MSQKEASNIVDGQQSNANVARRTQTIIVSVLVVAVVLSYLLIGWLIARDPENGAKERTPPVLVIDPYALQHAKKESLLEQDITSFDQVMAETEQFAVALDVVLNDYKEAGFVVVNRNAVIAAPDRLDITETVAQRLNLTMTPR